MPNGRTISDDTQNGALRPPAAHATLRETVKEALLNLLKDPEASAAAKASAGRTLLQYFDHETPAGRRRGADMTAAELDAAIASATLSEKE